MPWTLLPKQPGLPQQRQRPPLRHLKTKEGPCALPTPPARISDDQNRSQKWTGAEDIDDADGPTSPEQPSEPECNFFGIAGTLRASLLLWSLGLGLCTEVQELALGAPAWRRQSQDLKPNFLTPVPIMVPFAEIPEDVREGNTQSLVHSMQACPLHSCSCV